MSYYITPPQLRTYSPFFRATAVRKAKQAAEWADKEYQHALNIAIDKQRWGTVKVLAGEWSGMRVLSQLQDFHWFCAQLRLYPDVWDQLDRKTRKFIVKALEWYEGMRETKVQ